MLIIGDVAGIQDFIFDVPTEDTGGQARMLRARSFYVQILGEAIALRVQRALDLDPSSLLFCAAGKFAIEASAAADSVRERVDAEHVAIEEWLARETTGSLRVAIAIHDDDPTHATPADRYDAAMFELQRAKLRPWAGLGQGGGTAWSPGAFVLQPRPRDPELETFRRIGAALPRARALRLIDDPNAQLAVSTGVVAFGLPGFRAELSESHSGTQPQSIALQADLAGLSEFRETSRGQNRRPLARHIPTRADGSPMLFEELVRLARGVPYMGVLKMDADSLGVAIHHRLQTASDLRTLARFSAELDDFFAVAVTRLLRHPVWESTYTVFSGGDDLLLIGPWDRMLDLAGEIRASFTERFRDAALTLSGGLAIVRYRYPIHRAAARADELLDQAKAIPDPASNLPKDQFAALGQVWKWEHHERIVAAGKQLADWVDAGVARRGWLHTMLRLTQARRGDVPRTDAETEDVSHRRQRPGKPRRGTRAERLATTARLAYHIARNYPKADSVDHRARPLRIWADRVLDGFDRYETTRDPEVSFLPAIIRYALLATRTENPE